MFIALFTYSVTSTCPFIRAQSEYDVEDFLLFACKVSIGHRGFPIRDKIRSAQSADASVLLES